MPQAKALPEKVTYAPLWRRLAAMVYDGVILIAIWFCSTYLYLGLGKLVFGSVPTNPLVLQLTLFPLLLSVSFSFFYYFWHKNGQTLGMLAWRLHLITEEPSLTLRTALIRWGSSLVSITFFGLGYIYALFQKDRSCWHDQVSRTRLIFRAKN